MLYLALRWAEDCVISLTTAFVITNTKLYVAVLTVSTQDNAKLL